MTPPRTTPEPSPDRGPSPARRRARRAVRLALVTVLAALAVVWFTPSLFVRLATRAAYLAVGATPRTVMVDGRVWGYLEAGAPGADGAILLHGFGTSREAMMGILPWLATTHHAVAPDLPGFGQHPFHEGCTHDERFYAREVLRFADVIGLQRFDLVGTSMGGALAVHIAANHPDRVRRVVLLAPAGVKAPVQNDFMRSIERGENPLDIATEADLERVISLVFDKPPPVPWQFRRFMAEEAMRRRPCTLQIVEAIRPYLLDGARAELAKVQAPTLVVWGDRDRVTDRSMLDVFLAGIPGARGSLVAGAGHVVFSDAPEETRGVVVPFLAVAGP
jgi:pimeloyl-ACP methyl ester carboxylesterase